MPRKPIYQSGMKKVTFYMPEDLIDAAEKAAKEKKISFGAYLRRAVEKSLSEEKDIIESMIERYVMADNALAHGHDEKAEEERSFAKEAILKIVSITKKSYHSENGAAIYHKDGAIEMVNFLKEEK